MKSSAVRGVRGKILIAVSTAALSAFAVQALAGVAIGAAPAKSVLTPGYDSQATIIAKKKIVVSVSGVTAPSAVAVKIQRAGSTTESLLTKAATVTTGYGGSVSLNLSSTAKSKLTGCGTATLNTYVGGQKVSTEPFIADSTTCITSTPSQCDMLDPSECMYPFPNDYFTKADATTASGRRLDFKLAAMPVTTPTLFARTPKTMGVTEFNRFDGFSPGSMLITHVPGLTNDSAMTKSGLVRNTNLAAFSDTNQGAVVIDTVTGKRWPIWTELGRGYTDATLDGVAQTPENAVNLIIHPARNFLDGHRYVVALRGLKNSAGSTIPAGYGFKIFRDKIHTTKSAIESRRSKMESIFTTLANAGVSRSSLYLAWDFTVASTKSLSERLLKVRNDAFSKLGDTTMGDSTIQGTSPVWHVTTVRDTPSDPDTIRQIDGTIEVPCYLTSTNCATGGVFNLGPDGLPTQNGSSIQLARFRCNIPQSAVDGNGKVEMTLYGHGLFGSINEMGSRNVRQLGNAERMLVCGSDWSGMASEDELTAAGILSDLTNFNKMADRLQQGYLNFMYLGRALAHPSGLTTDTAFQVTSGDNSASYGVGNIAYYGNSQGGIAGGGLTAISPDILRSVLYVGAMNYSLLLPRSVDFDEFKPFFYPNYTKLIERPLLFGLMQIEWDRGEPNGYANHITSDPLPNTPAKHVTMEMSYGDHQVANIATEVEARTLGLRVRLPYLDPGRDTTGTINAWGLNSLNALGSLPLDANALIVWDIGHYRDPDAPNCKDNSSDTWCGTPSPPADDSPNRVGTDPHDMNIDTSAALRHQIAEYIKPGGKLVDVCDGKPCYGAGWTGAP